MQRILPATIIAALGVFAPANAQDLSEIEAWVFEPVLDPNGMPIRGARDTLTDEGLIFSQARISPQTGPGQSTARPFIVIDGVAMFLPPLKGVGRMEFRGADERGAVYIRAFDATTDEVIIDTLMWNGESYQFVEVTGTGSAFIAQRDPSGRATGLGMNSSDPEKLDLVIWDDTLQPGFAFPIPEFPLAAESGEQTSFSPIHLLADNGIIGINIGSNRDQLPASIAWINPDGSVDENDLGDLADDVPDLIRPLSYFVPRSDDVYLLMERIWWEPYRTQFVLAQATRHDAQVLEEYEENTYIELRGDLDGLFVREERLQLLASYQPPRWIVSKNGTSLDLRKMIASNRIPLNLGDLNTRVEFLTDGGILRPTTCLADVNTDGVLSTDEFTAWVDAYLNEESIADQNLSQSVEPSDFFAWVVRFQSGCP